MAAKKSRSKTRSPKRKYRIEMTSLSLAFWGLCLVFLLAWVFVLGILVGRGFLPSNFSLVSGLKNQITKLEEMGAGQDSQPRGTLVSKPPKDPELLFYEKLSSKKAEAKKAEETEKKKKTAIRDQERTRGQGLASRKALAPTPRGPHYTIQIASLDDEGRAKRLIGQLKDKGFSAYYYKATVKGKTYYRVRYGKFSSRKVALDFARKLEQEAGLRGFVSRLD